jgi:hypothetical protein
MRLKDPFTITAETMHGKQISCTLKLKTPRNLIVFQHMPPSAALQASYREFSTRNLGEEIQPQEEHVLSESC